MIGKDILEELVVVLPALAHVRELPHRLLLPHEVEAGRDLHQTPVVRHHEEEKHQEHAHPRREADHTRGRDDTVARVGLAGRVRGEGGRGEKEGMVW